MRQVIVRYKVKPEHVAENERLVRAVYEELAQVKPDGFRYATYRLDDGVTFVHLAQSEHERAPLPELEAFRHFQEGIVERCDEPPVVTDAETIGSYNGGPR
jgi:hypothetical protein